MQYSKMIQNDLKAEVSDMAPISPKRIKVQVSNLEVNDLIRAAIKRDPVRADPEVKRLLEIPWEDLRDAVDAYVQTQEPRLPDPAYFEPKTFRVTPEAFSGIEIAPADEWKARAS